jgi:hypothetical protein
MCIRLMSLIVFTEIFRIVDYNRKGSEQTLNLSLFKLCNFNLSHSTFLQFRLILALR